MHLTLTIEADHPGELTPFLASFGSHPGKATAIKEVEPGDADPYPEETEEVVAPAPKKSRTKRGSASTSTSAPPTSSEPELTSEIAPAEEVTFEDLRAKASALMDSGKIDGRAIQNMLIEKFDARAFGALKQEQYPQVLAELENLAA